VDSHKVMSWSCSKDSWQVRRTAVGVRSFRSGSQKKKVKKAEIVFKIGILLVSTLL